VGLNGVACNGPQAVIREGGRPADPARRATGQRWLGAALFACLATATTGCAASSSYMGINLTPGDAPASVQALALRARQGDKQAALDLGKRLEAGDGVPQDLTRAMRLYRMAASDSGGTIWVYSPSPGNGAPGRVIPVDRGPRVAGLAEARERLGKR